MDPLLFICIIAGKPSSASGGVVQVIHLDVSAPSAALQGTQTTVTVTARDSVNNLVPNYNGVVHFTSSDGAAALPPDTGLENGTASFPVTLNTVGAQTITATDKINATITGTTGSIAVTAAGATHFSVVAPATATVGGAVSVVVTALTAAGATATGYTGIVHFTSNDGTAVLPADSTLSSGLGTFLVTFNMAGSRTVTATDTVSGSITGTSGTVTVSMSTGGGFGGGGVAGTPTLNGTVGSDFGPQGSTAVFSTTVPNTIVIGCCQNTSNVYFSGFSSPNLPQSAWKRIGRNTASGTHSVEIWYAICPNILTNEPVTSIGGTDFYNTFVFAVANVNLSFPFDPSFYPFFPAMMGLNLANFGLPATIRANTMAIVFQTFSVNTPTPTVGTGWTKVGLNRPNCAVAVQSFSAQTPAFAGAFAAGGGDGNQGASVAIVLTANSNDPIDVPIDGGPTYFADNGLTYAHNAGWDSPNFFIKGSFLAYMPPPPDTRMDGFVNTLHWNCLYGRTGNDTDLSGGGTSLAAVRAHGGIWVIDSIQCYWYGYETNGTHNRATGPVTFNITDERLTAGPTVGTQISAVSFDYPTQSVQLIGTVQSYTKGSPSTVTINVTTANGNAPSFTGTWALGFGSNYGPNLGWIVDGGNAMSTEIGTETVGLVYMDEFQGHDEFGNAQNWGSAVTRRVNNLPNSFSDGRMLVLQFTIGLPAGHNFGPSAPGPPDAFYTLNQLESTPNATTRKTVNFHTIDNYFFAIGKLGFSNGASLWNEDWLAGGNALTQDQYQRGSNYGDLVDMIRYAKCAYPSPTGVAIETGDAKIGASLVSQLIVPPEINWLCWSQIIHGALALLFFDHNTGPSPYGGDDCLLTNANYAIPLPGQTVSIRDQVATICSMVDTYARIIKSPTAAQYCRASPPGYVAPTPFISLPPTGIDVCVKHYTGGAPFTNGYYMFATTRAGESQTNIMATFTLNQAINASSVTVLYDSEGTDTNLVIPIASRQFSHNYPHAWTVRIYRFNP
jgi:hypothetical protein